MLLMIREVFPSKIWTRAIRENFYPRKNLLHGIIASSINLSILIEHTIMPLTNTGSYSNDTMISITSVLAVRD